VTLIDIDQVEVMPDKLADLPFRAGCCLLTAAQQIAVACGLPKVKHRYASHTGYGRGSAGLPNLPPCQCSFMLFSPSGIRMEYDRAACVTMCFNQFDFVVGRCGSPTILDQTVPQCDGDHSILGECQQCGEVPPLYPSDPHDCPTAGNQNHTTTSHAFWRSREMNAFAMGIEDKWCQCFARCAPPGRRCTRPRLTGTISTWETGGWSGFRAKLESLIG